MQHNNRGRATVTGVLCPKCADVMETLDRAGVHVERCQNCGGIFLDRGELEALFTAEHEHYAQVREDQTARMQTAPMQTAPMQTPAEPQRYEPPADYRGRHDHDDRHDDRHRRDDPYRQAAWDRDPNAPRERRPYDWLDEPHHDPDRRSKSSSSSSSGQDFLRILFGR